jgi:hypothetical protein
MRGIRKKPNATKSVKKTIFAGVSKAVGAQKDGAEEPARDENERRYFGSHS